MPATIVVGRFGNNQTVTVNDGTSIRSALTQHGYSPSENEVIRDIAQAEYTGSEPVQHGKGYFLVESVKSGSQ